MTTAVIIIGHNPNNRMSAAFSIAAAGNIVSVDACSPICVSSQKVVISPDAALPSGYRVVYDASAEAKPAEIYVLKFATEQHAKDWLEAVPPVELVGKTVLLMDPSTP